MKRDQNSINQTGILTTHSTPLSLCNSKIERLSLALAPLHAQFDPKVQLLIESYEPHQFLKIFKGVPVHPTRKSLEYALGILASDRTDLRCRALNIIQKIVNLQVTKVDSQNYGLWPKYWEEKPFTILRPDKNWVEFLSTLLLQVVINHRHQLPSELANLIDLSILRSAKVIYKRDTPLAYTNVAIMGIYVTLITGQNYGNESLYEYGIKRLQLLYRRLQQQGEFDEYNSPTYTLITLEVLTRLYLHVSDNTAKNLIMALFRMTWLNVALHFHPPTCQWSGPHSRNYSTLLNPKILAFIDQATSQHVNFKLPAGTISSTLASYYLPMDCPAELEKYFISLNGSRSLSTNISNKKTSKILTTFIDSQFTLSSASLSDFWHQRQPLIAYWGNLQKIGFLKLRVLCNGQDCAAAQFFSIQDRGRVIIGINFAEDIDAINPYANGKKKVISNLRINDLRLRFEFNELIDRTKVYVPGDPKLPINFKFENLRLQIMAAYTRIEHVSMKWELFDIGQKKSSLDLILDKPSRHRPIRLQKGTHAAIGLLINISDKSTKLEPRLSLSDDCLNIQSWGMKLNIMSVVEAQLNLIEKFTRC